MHSGRIGCGKKELWFNECRVHIGNDEKVLGIDRVLGIK
jgi:hypothetical protein